MSLFVFFISLLIVAQHVSGNHVPIIRSWRLRDVIALCWYVPWLQKGGQVRLVGSASMDALPTNRSIVGFMLDINCWIYVGYQLVHLEITKNNIHGILSEKKPAIYIHNQWKERSKRGTRLHYFEKIRKYVDHWIIPTSKIGRLNRLIRLL